MSHTLRSWLQNRVLNAPHDRGAPSAGGRIQIVQVRYSNQFITYEADIHATVCDKTHFITARFSDAVVDKFRDSPVRFTQMKGAYFAVRQCSVVPVNCSVVLHIQDADLLGGLFDSVHSDTLRGVLAIERPPAALVKWVNESGKT